MGLDMYLTAEQYVGGWDHSSDEEKARYAMLMGAVGATPYHCDGAPSLTVQVTIGYWRKANHIHKWFVDNVQDGRDECQSSYVDRESLVTLRDVCQQILKASALIPGKVYAGTRYSGGDEPEVMTNDGLVVADPSVAQELLPTGAGFFFGSTDYDEYYVADVQRTVEAIDKALAMPGSWSFEYRSSW